MATTTATQIQQLYVGLLGRAADQGGLNWWADQVTTGGKTLEDVRASFVTSTEYTTTYGAAATRADLVTSIYQNLFERTPSADEVKYWAETDTRPADQLVAAFIEFAGAADQAVINNKTFVAQTYTDTAGTAFNKAAATSVIDNVNGTPASVTAAVGTISNGTLPGLVPAAGLIADKIAADAKVAAYGVAVAKSNPTFDGIDDSDATPNNPLNEKDGVVTAAEAADALAIAKTARGDVTTATLNANVINANDALKVIKATATATPTGNNAVSTYDAAAAKLAAATGTAAEVAARDVAKGSAVGGLDAALLVTDSVVTSATLEAATQGATGIAGAKTLFNFYVNTSTSSVDRAALVAEVTKLGATGTTFLAAADKALAINTATDAVATAKTGLDAAVTAPVADEYVAKVAAVKSATDAVTKAAADDVKVAAAKAVVDQYKVLTDAAGKAGEALTKFGTDNSTTVKLHDVKAAVPDLTGSALKDVFYFGTKVAAADDFAISGFSTGDAVVLGNGFTFNSGALSTGVVGTQEFFLVQGAHGVQIVAESAAYGSSTATANATTGVVTTASGTDAVSIITLTGVTIDHVAVSGGVVSYV